MDDGLLCTDQRLNGALDQVFPGLHQDLKPNVIGRAVFLDQSAIESEFCIRSGREADFNLFEATFDERLKHLELLADIHRNGERLISVTQIYAAPDRGLLEDAARPFPTAQWDGGKWPVFRGWFLEHGCVAFSCCC